MKRVLWMAFTLLGITLVTFAVFDLAPVDRATVEVARAAQDGAFVDAPARETAILQLRLRYGTIDPETYAPRPLAERYLHWLGRAVRLDFAGPNEDPQALWGRFLAALPVTMLLGFLSVVVALAIGVPLGGRLGADAGSRLDRLFGRALLLCSGLPEYLVGTLLLLLFAGVLWNVFPSHGLVSAAAHDWNVVARAADLLWHLVLPVTVMALGPTVVVVRFVRDAVARAAAQPFAEHWRALGLQPEVVRRRLRHHGAVPLATLAGGLLPMLVGGSVVVEHLFSLNGLGNLAFQAVRDQDQSMVMLVVVVGSLATLLSLLLSDVLHRCVDPRVRLSA
ncbi:MAG: ABC transporter permease [Planctomycetes bacterium]|nr:ABC transporter permease [Planctomycetota bacterium]MCB9884261.1 ABC transporter permease [Planctomycetota bacterium]